MADPQSAPGAIAAGEQTLEKGLLDQIVERRGIITSRDQRAQSEICNLRHGAEKAIQTFISPIVPNKEQNEFIVSNRKCIAGSKAQAGATFGRETVQINPAVDHADFTQWAVESSQIVGNSVRDRRDAHIGSAVNMWLEGRYKSIEQPAMNDSRPIDNRILA